jgi:ribosomal protein S18 acetylase RimI-like enzyme
MIVVREAGTHDVDEIHRFGERVLPPHYTPLIGAVAAQGQVDTWWKPTQIQAAVTQRLMVVAEADGQVVGVGERGRYGDDHVIYKLYVAPEQRGHGLGPRLIAALVEQLPADVERLYIEHFAANERAGAFYEREGYAVERTEPSPNGDPALAVVWRVRRLVRD